MKIVVLNLAEHQLEILKKLKMSQTLLVFTKKKYQVIVVSSAMSGVTNDLIKKSKEISDSSSEAEYDVLVSSGEQVACSLIAGRLMHKGFKSRSWLSWQIPILTKGLHKYSKITLINKKEIIKYIKTEGYLIVTGFQGINLNHRVTTIGRGGSDASAIMLAKFLKAERCVIYTDVDGVYTTDPNKIQKAKD